jgi:putative Holliday junction resolvase
MRILGVDYGTVRVGLAISDPGGIIAQPAGILPAAPPDTLPERLLAKARELRAEKILFGLPRHLDGRDGDHAPAIRRLGERLAELAAPPVAFWEERLSTQAAERAMIEADVSRRDRRSKIDAVAAAIILQNYLDAQQIAHGERLA